MNKNRVFNEKEIEELLKNSNIIEIRDKAQLIYKNEFKLWAVLQKLKYPEKTAREIFELAGFNMNILNERTPQRRLSLWKKRYEEFGVEYFISNNNYRYKSIKKIYDTPTINNQTKNDIDIISSMKKNNLLVCKLIISVEKLLEKCNEKINN